MDRPVRPGRHAAFPSFMTSSWLSLGARLKGGRPGVRALKRIMGPERGMNCLRRRTPKEQNLSAGSFSPLHDYPSPKQIPRPRAVWTKDP
jgi:hypothetical protein